nr:hypothetical protein [Mycoplasma simbae]
MAYKPINDTSTIEIVKSGNDQVLSEDKKIVRDPKNQISPRVYRVIRTEKNIKLFNLSFSYLIMLAAIILFTLAYLQIGVFEQRQLGYLIGFGVAGFIFFALGTKNLIENIQWSHTIQRYREAIQAGDYTSSNTFHLAYRQIILKGVNLTWILIFVLTYLGLFTIIVYGLYSAKNLGYSSAEVDGSFIKFNINWEAILDKGFKNTNVFCLICLAIMGALIAFYIIMRLIDKKRLADLDDFLGERSVEIHEQINKAKKDRNKAWMIAYFVIVALTILLPLAIILVGVWRGIKKRKNK